MPNKKSYVKVSAPRIKFRNCRNEKELTQRRLAEIFDVTEVTIRNVEAGRGFPSQEFMVKAAEFFNTDVFELFPDAPLLKHLKQTKFSRA